MSRERPEAALRSYGAVPTLEPMADMPMAPSWALSSTTNMALGNWKASLTIQPCQRFLRGGRL